MSPKSKTQKRNERARKAAHPDSDRSVNSNKQQKALSSLKTQFDEQAVFVRQQAAAIEALKLQADPKKQIMMHDQKLDEKYVKVPDSVDIALGKLIDIVDESLKPKKGNNALMVDVVDKHNILADVRNAVKSIQDETKKLVLSKPIANNALTAQVELLKRRFNLFWVTGKSSHPNHLYAGHPNFLRFGEDGGIKLKKMSIDLADVKKTFTSSANTAFNAPYALTPGASAEFASLASLFDLYICIGVTLQVRLLATMSTTIDPPVVDGIWVYDPIDNSSYNSIVTAIIASQKLGPVSLVGQSDFSNTGLGRSYAPLSSAPHGFWIKRFKCPISPSESPTVSVEILTGHWDSTIDPGGIYGYIKPYVESGGANVTTTQYWYVIYHCMFKSRT